MRVRFADLRSMTRSVTLRTPISATAMLAEVAEELVRGADLGAGDTRKSAIDAKQTSDALVDEC